MLPPEIAPQYYRDRYPDLASMSDVDIIDHYHTWGRNEGRVASPAGDRLGFLSTIRIDGLVLEIGPFCNPALNGPHVRYFDVLDREQLLERADFHKMDPAACPSQIDYVSPVGDLSIVPAGFDAAFSSHCIEHQPDLINHLKQVRRIVGAEGRYFMAVPDKRFCFDHYIEETLTSELILAHQEKRTFHTFRSIYNYFTYTTHNDSVLHWQGQHSDGREPERTARAMDAFEIYRDLDGAYFDCHAWQFTPEGFRTSMTALSADGHIPFTVERLYSTAENTNEFYCVLKAA